MGYVGNIMGFLFYTLVFIAAITSSISLLEVITAYQGRQECRSRARLPDAKNMQFSQPA